MIRLFGGATLLFSAISAHAGLIATDPPGYARLGAAYPLDDGDVLSNGSGWDSGDAWQDPGRETNALAPQAQGRFDIHGFDISFLPEAPTADATPIPEPATLALFGLAAGALGLARQGKNKRA